MFGGWFRDEGARLLGWLREPGLWAALLLGLLVFGFAYQVHPSIVLPIGGDSISHKRHYDAPFLVGEGFNAPEPGSGEWWLGQPYRWASDDALVRLPGVGGSRWELSVLAASGRPDGSAVESVWQVGDGPPQTLQIGAAPRVYHIVGDARNGDLELRLRTPRFDAPGDSRNLGLVVQRISVRVADAGPQLPAPWQLGWLLGCLALGYGMLRRLRLPPVWAFRTAVLALVPLALMLLRHRLALTIWSPRLLLVVLGCYGLALVLQPLLSAASRAVGLRVSIGELCAAVGASVVAFGVRVAGVLHPYARFSDLGFNINNLDGVIQGRLFLYAGLPSEVGGGQAPYPPGQYLVLAPLRLLFGATREQIGWLIQIGNALLECGSAALVWLLLRRVGLGKRAALLGAALYVPIPPLLRSYSIGEYANIFGQTLLMPLLVFLVIGAPRASRWPAAVFGSLLLLMILFSHTGVIISTMAVLVAWLPLWWWQNRPTVPWKLIVGGLAAGLLATLLFYSNYVGLLEQRASQSAVQQLSGTPLGIKVWNELRVGFSEARGISPLLGVGGLLGWLLIGRRREWRLDIALSACWLGLLFSFSILLGSDQAVRWHAFLFPALCLGAGPWLAALWRRGRAGAVLALLVAAYLSWFGLALWINQIVQYLH